MIEQLQSHENHTVYTKAFGLIDTFFSEEVSYTAKLIWTKSYDFLYLSE